MAQLPKGAVPLRRLLVAIALVSTVTFALAGAGTALASAARLPPEGIFEDCSLDTQMATCVQRLDVMHEGGIRVVVISAGGTSLSSLQAYSDAAHALGMSVMWELSNPSWWQDSSTSTSMSGYYPAFATSCGCTQNGALLSYVAQWLGSLPGTYGYYAADDSALAPGDQAGVAQYVAQIKQADPVHTVMIGSADQSQMNSYQGIADLIGTEIYPVTTSSLMPVSANQSMWGDVAQTAIDAQSSANADHKQSAVILQAFTWGDNVDDGQAIGSCSPTDSQASCYAKLQYPSAAEQLTLRNEVLTHSHPQLILWWSFQGTYGQAGDDTYSIYPTGGQAAARWAGLSSAIQAPAPQASGGARRKHLRVTKNSVTAAASGSSISLPPASSTTSHHGHTGATVSYSDAQAAQTTLTVSHDLPGLESAHRCVAASRAQRRLAHGTHCTRFSAIGSFRHMDHVGANSFHFTGRINGYKLKAGKYRLLAFGTLGHRHGTSAATTFRVVR